MGREVKRVPLDFDWPLGRTWQGFLMPKGLHALDCPDCEGTGYAPRAHELKNLWYGYEPFSPEDNGSTPLRPDTPGVRAVAERNVTNSPDYYGTGEAAIVREAKRLCSLWNTQWSHHLSVEDVFALIEAGRLMDLTHTFTRETRWQPKDPPYLPTPEEVNAWSLSGFGHDSVNAHVCVKARCEREGISDECATCSGAGSVFRDDEHRMAHDGWAETKVPTGDGWQVWETVSEGSPITPVFPTAEALVDHLATVGTLWDQRGGDGPWRRSAAESFVSSGWAPSMVTRGDQVMLGGRDADIMDAS
jgi:hypothetical protein